MLPQNNARTNVIKAAKRYNIILYSEYKTKLRFYLLILICNNNNNNNTVILIDFV